MKIRVRKKLDHNVCAASGDRIALKVDGIDLFESKVGRYMQINEIAIADIDESDVPGKSGIAGLFLEDIKRR